MSRNLPLAVALLAAAALAAPARAQFVPGDLYVSSYSFNKIYRIEPGTWNVSTFVDSQSGIDGPTAKIFTPAGTMLCSSYWNDKIIEIDASGNGTTLFDFSDGIKYPAGENGLAYDANGDLYVSLFVDHKILRFPSGGGAATVFADSADGIHHPDGLAFAANGDLFVANRAEYEVLKIDPAGVASVFDTLPHDPNSIAFRANGDLFVATDGTSSKIYKYAGGDAAQRTLFEDFTNNKGVVSLQVSPDQTKVYFTSSFNGNLIEIDADTGAYTEVIAAGGLPSAVGISFFGPRHGAAWSNYGSGVAGTNGVPYFTSQNDPVLGSTITLDLGNSYGQPTSGLLILGFQQASLPTGLGGDLLLIPALLVPISFSYGAIFFTGTLPSDPAFDGFELDLQAVEVDPGAVEGVSFTRGLQLLLGW